MLPISNVVCKLLAMEGGAGPPCAMLGNKHMICWGFEDLLTNREKEAAVAAAAAAQNGGQQPATTGNSN